MNTRARAPLIGCTLFLSVAIQSTAMADTGEADAAKLAQNPIASVISFPFQNNTNLNYGPQRDTLNDLNVQPVIHPTDAVARSRESLPSPPSQSPAKGPALSA